MDKRTPQERIASLEGMRGIACLCIVCYHYFCLFADDQGLGFDAVPWMGAARVFFAYSKNAVELFFMLSGFLTAWHYRDRLRGMSFSAFFRRRYGKLLGASVAVTAWALANALLRERLALTGGLSATTPLRVVLSCLMVNTGLFTSYAQTGLPVNSTMWFIDVLLVCYLIYYAIGRLTGRPRVRLLLYAAMTALGWVCLEHTPKLPFLWSLNGRGYAPFFLGVLLAEFQALAPAARRRRVSLVLAVLVLGFFLFHTAAGFERVFGPVGSRAYVRYFEFVAAPALVLAALNLPAVSAFFSLRPFLFLGSLSAAVYYVHNCVLEDAMILCRLAGDPVSLLAFPAFLLLMLAMLPAAWLYEKAAGAAERALGKHLPSRAR